MSTTSSSHTIVSETEAVDPVDFEEFVNHSYGGNRDPVAQVKRFGFSAVFPGIVHCTPSRGLSPWHTNRNHQTWPAQWADMGGQGGNRANRATDLILVSMPKDLGMGNRLRPFPDTPD